MCPEVSTQVHVQLGLVGAGGSPESPDGRHVATILQIAVGSKPGGLAGLLGHLA